MMMRLFNLLTFNKLEQLKQELSSLLTQEWTSSKYSTQANVFFQEASKLILNCQNEEEVKKLMVGCLTLAFITDDRKYRTKLSKYSYEEISSAAQNPETDYYLKTKVPHYTPENNYIHAHTGSTYDDYPSEKSFLSSFYNVAEYVLRNPLGCDSFDKTYYLKTNTFIASLNKGAVTAVATEQTPLPSAQESPQSDSKTLKK